MASAPKASSRIRKLTKLVPDYRVTGALLLGLQDRNQPETDRMIGIVGGAHVENALYVLILSRLVPLSANDHNQLFDNGGNGVLANFSSKIQLGFALGLFGPKTREDLDNIRHIRNAFAHSLEHIKFEQEDIAAACVALHHTGKVDLATALRGPKSYFVRSVLNISKAMRESIEGKGLLGLGRISFPHQSLP